jgi:hypothetical protein
MSIFGTIMSKILGKMPASPATYAPAARSAQTSGAVGSRRAPAWRSFFKSLLRIKVGLRVHRTHRDAGEEGRRRHR